MTELFVPYEIAIELKSLGFDDICLTYYKNNILSDELEEVKNSEIRNVNNEIDNFIASPIFSQAFKFFREKYGLYVYYCPEFYKTGINFNWQIFWYTPESDKQLYEGTMQYGDNGEYPTQEAAELACLQKLISIANETK